VNQSTNALSHLIHCYIISIVNRASLNKPRIDQQS